MLKTLGFVQVIVLISVASLFILTWDFGRRVVENVQLVQASQAADVDLARVERENAQLQQLKSDVGKDEWVERKARTGLHYTRDGETLFIPIHRVAPASPPSPVVVAPPSPRPVWQDWLEAIFGPSQ